MSSHHFVKEGQESELWVLNVNSILLERITELVGWGPKVVSHFDSLGWLMMHGVKVDACMSLEEKKEIAPILTQIQSHNQVWDQT